MERPAVLYDCNGLYSCHLDKIVNLLGRLSLGTPVREFVDLVYWGVKSHSRLGWQHPMGWGPRLKSKKRRSRAPSFSLFLDCRCNVTCDLVFLQPYFPHHDRSELPTAGQHKPFLFKWLHVGHFVSATTATKKTATMASHASCSVSHQTTLSWAGRQLYNSYIFPGRHMNIHLYWW